MLFVDFEAMEMSTEQPRSDRIRILLVVSAFLFPIFHNIFGKKNLIFASMKLMFICAHQLKYYIRAILAQERVTNSDVHVMIV